MNKTHFAALGLGLAAMAFAGLGQAAGPPASCNNPNKPCSPTFTPTVTEEQSPTLTRTPLPPSPTHTPSVTPSATLPRPAPPVDYARPGALWGSRDSAMMGAAPPRAGGARPFASRGGPLKLDDRQLVAGVLGGDEKAQEAFDGQFRARLKATAIHFLGYGEAEVEDVVQETFLTAHRNLGQFEFKSGLYLWLNRICVNFCMRRLRQRYRLLLSQQEEMEAHSLGRSLAQQAERDEAREREEMARTLSQAILAMQEPCREVLTLRHLREEPYVRIAALVKVPIGTVMSRLARCREALKQALASRPGKAGHG